MWNYPHFFETLRPLLYVQLFQLFWYLSTGMGLTLWFLLHPMGLYMWLLVDEFNSQYWWNYPHFLTLEPLCTCRLFQLNYFGIFQLGWALTLCSFSACSMGCNIWLLVDEFNSQYWELSHFFDTLVICTYRLFQLQLFWYLSTRMGPNLSFLFSTLNGL
jgi:hypothetical protein